MTTVAPRIEAGPLNEWMLNDDVHAPPIQESEDPASLQKPVTDEMKPGDEPGEEIKVHKPGDWVFKKDTPLKVLKISAKFPDRIQVREGKSALFPDGHTEQAYNREDWATVLESLRRAKMEAMPVVDREALRKKEQKQQAKDTKDKARKNRIQNLFGDPEKIKGQGRLANARKKVGAAWKSLTIKTADAFGAVRKKVFSPFSALGKRIIGASEKAGTKIRGLKSLLANFRVGWLRWTTPEGLPKLHPIAGNNASPELVDNRKKCLTEHLVPVEKKMKQLEKEHWEKRDPDSLKNSPAGKALTTRLASGDDPNKILRGLHVRHVMEGWSGVIVKVDDATGVVKLVRRRIFDKTGKKVPPPRPPLRVMEETVENLFGGKMGDTEIYKKKDEDTRTFADSKAAKMAVKGGAAAVAGSIAVGKKAAAGTKAGLRAAADKS